MISLIFLRVMLYSQTFLQHFYKLFWLQILIGSHMDPPLTSFFLLTSNHLLHQIIYKKICSASIFLILVI